MADGDKLVNLDGLKAVYDKIDGDVGDLKSATEEHDTEIAMVVTKVEVPPEAPTTATQVIDLTNAVHVAGSTSYAWDRFIFPIHWIGKYYINPSGAGYKLFLAYPYNSNDELVALYRNGSSYSYMSIPENGWVDVVDKRTFNVYNSNGVLDWTWTADDDVAYFAKSGGNDIRLGYATGSTDKIGITFYEASQTYLEYTPYTPGEPTYDYEYSDNLDDHVYEKLAANHTDNEPTEGSSDFVKSGGVVSFLLKDSYNLVDPSWFDWDRPEGGYILLKSGMYLPVTAGNVLLCNCEKVVYYFYDSNKVQLQTGGSASTAIAYAPATVSDGAVYMRIQLNNGTGYIPNDRTVVIYYSNNAESPRDDIRPYILHKNLIGMRGSNEIFDHYAPSALDREILQMAKYAAVRNVNFCNNIVRIGTFNMYLPRGTYNWEATRKMLKDHALDIVGFQEVSNSNSRVLTAYLNGWQFADGATDAPVAVASHFEVLSSNSYTTESTNRKYMKTVIQLPRYADSVNPTLSVYDYHGIWDGGSVELRTQEIEEILEKIENDTSDFIVVVGDTNATAPHAEWDVWREAGFTPVHNGVGVNTTTDNPPLCLDNIFFGAGITCKSYHVVPASDYMIMYSGQSVTISDHDMVFADLQFDFDSLLEN